MKKILAIGISLSLISLILLISLISAHNNAPFDHRYHGDPGKSSASNYKTSSSRNYNSNYGSNSYSSNYNSNRMPIFKGSYGNYRYQMYASGDYKPTYFFVDYPDYGYPSYFGGGYGGGYYGGYGLGYNYYSRPYYYYPAYTVPFFSY